MNRREGPETARRTVRYEPVPLASDAGPEQATGRARPASISHPAPTVPALRFGPQDQRPVCTVHQKVAFSRKYDAQLAIKSIRERSPHIEAPDWLWQAYYVWECGWWHIGHSGKRNG